jgi:hypothetical protein
LFRPPDSAGGYPGDYFVPEAWEKDVMRVTVMEGKSANIPGLSTTLGS